MVIPAGSVAWDMARDSMFIIGGTRFIGRYTVSEFLEHGYDVTMFTRGRAPNPFADDDRVRHITGDRTVPKDLERAAGQTDPDVVIDSVAYHPRGVEEALRWFGDAEAYVYLSSAAAYQTQPIPMREDETPLHPCGPEEATDDAYASYGPRKAEGDRIVFAAADQGARAMSVRPPVVIGPHDYLRRYDYWIERVRGYDRVVVPGDGQNLRHQTYVRDVARALRVVAERGGAGAAYNVADHRLTTITDQLDLMAEAAGTTVEPVFANDRELAVAGLSPGDFPLYRDYPYVLATHKLEALGWSATAPEETIPATVTHHIEHDRSGRDQGPARSAETRVIERIESLG